MKVIIAGTRTITRLDLVERAVKESGFGITLEVSGDAPGVDRVGAYWARQHGIPVKEFPAAWHNYDHPGAIVRLRKDGSLYDAAAGHHRNKQMAEFADALILIWDGKSKGSKNMKARAKKHGLKIYELIVCGRDREEPTPQLPDIFPGRKIEEVPSFLSGWEKVIQEIEL